MELTPAQHERGGFLIFPHPFTSAKIAELRMEVTRRRQARLLEEVPREQTGGVKSNPSAENRWYVYISCNAIANRPLLGLDRALTGWPGGIGAGVNRGR
jgi:hypothetical protein